MRASWTAQWPATLTYSLPASVALRLTTIDTPALVEPTNTAYLGFLIITLTEPIIAITSESLRFYSHHPIRVGQYLHIEGKFYRYTRADQ